MRRESPGPVHDDPNRQADLAIAYGRLELAVPQVDELGGDPMDSQVGIARPGSTGSAQRRVRERFAGQF